MQDGAQGSAFRVDPATPTAGFSAAAVRFDSVTVTFPATDSRQDGYTALRDLSLTVADGEFLSVVGPTGSGKTTILNLAAGLLQPSAGTVTVFGERLVGLNRRAGYLFQADAIMPWRNVLQNVVAGLEIAGVPEPARSRRANEWLARVGLRGKGLLYPYQLSGGMRRRVALAQMLILNPRVVLMDEPFSALDVQTRQLMENELLDLWSMDRKSVIFITHDLEEAIALSDRVVVLSMGPATRAIGEFQIDLPRPRDVAEIRAEPRFANYYARIWDCMRPEVLKSYRDERDA